MATNTILILIALTLLPFLELRASIPYGIFNTDLNWISVFLICVITNIILGPIVYLLLDKIVFVFTKIKIIDRLYQKYVEKTQKRIQGYVDKYGLIGVSIFIGIPLPGSGVYSGALGAYLLGINFKRFLIASIIGVLIAGVLVTLISLTGGGIFSFLIKRI
ncbi:small multi-drug export protein [Candidatus Woesearchaeota archaeon]|nr:small multi-drug export protein [Candidatus Woesearchaeota archaeon]